MATKKSTTTSRRRKTSSSKPNPYLLLGILLCIAAVALIIAILVLASTDNPAELPEESSLSSAPAESSADPTSSATSSSAPVITISDPSEYSSAESSEAESNPPTVGPVGPIEQLASTKAYEQEIGMCYSIDMSYYEQYVCPEDPMEYVFLVNPTHTLAADFVPGDLIDIKDMKPGRPSYYCQMREYAEKALEAFLEEGRVYGIDDVLVSNGYRSYAIQATLFSNYCAEERAAHPDYTEEQIIALVLTYSTRPGTSEHQSGLCCDMHNRPSTDLSFAGTEAALWLEANCYRFGFILRYPEDKQDITGIMFEPWHFRYVGRVAATEMHDLGMCLEEYCAYKGID